jgi:hypothetical protein
LVISVFKTKNLLSQPYSLSYFDLMNAVQPELDFRSAIALALAEPEAADLRQLWRSLEPKLRGLSQKEQLSVAGQALCDLAEVCQRRAELMWVEWQDRHNTEGPIPDEDFLSGLVQKTMFLDISELVKQPKPRRVDGRVEEEGESVVEEVTKEQALLLAGAEDMLEIDVEQEIRHQGYDEDIAAWAEAVGGWLNRQVADEVTFAELLKGTGLSLVKVWLALILGNFDLRPLKEFYDGVAIRALHVAIDRG